MYIKDLKTGQKKLLFDASHAKHAPPLTRPIEEQGERESQKLWLKTVKAVHIVDHENATIEKAKIEDRQREEAKRREEMGVDWQPKLFRRVEAGPGGSEEGEEDLEWIIHAQLDSNDPKELEDKILSIAPILPGQGQPKHGSEDIAESKRPAKESTSGASQVKATSPAPQSHVDRHAPDNLIDLDSRPASTAPPEASTKSDSTAGNATHPTNPQQTPVHQSTAMNAPLGNPPKSGNLMDDDGDLTHMNSQMSKMKVHETMVPEGRVPLKRADTETNDVDVFVDAEG